MPGTGYGTQNTATAKPLVLPDHIHRRAAAAGPAIIVPGTPPAIEFEHVSFAYESGMEIFSDLSLAIPFGKKAALVGSSGSGYAGMGRCGCVGFPHAEPTHPHTQPLPHRIALQEEYAVATHVPVLRAALGHHPREWPGVVEGVVVERMGIGFNCRTAGLAPNAPNHCAWWRGGVVAGYS
jgi:hypothetical protein